MLELQHPIQVVSHLTGLSPHVIRVWEKRYQAVRPGRTPSNRRLYSDAEVERLRWMARAIQGGHKIGFIARLDTEALVALVGRIEGSGAAARLGLESGGDVGQPVARESTNGGAVRVDPGLPELDVDSALVREALDATRGFRSAELMRVLEQGTVRFGQSGVLQRLICPLAQTIGDLWQKGELTAAHEHFASALFRDFLAVYTRPYTTMDGAPRIVVGTPAGQLHETGAIMVAALTTHLGWRPIYLGTALPAGDLAGAAVQNGVRAVCLSLIYPADDPHLGEELVRLRRLLPRGVEIVVGGRAAGGYKQVLQEIGALVPGTLDELARRLEDLRKGPD